MDVIKKTIKMSDMSDTSSKKSRRQVSHEQDIQNSSVLCNVVANVVVVAADVELRQRRLRRKRTRNVVRKCRVHRVRKRRFVEDIYKELGPVFFRRAYRMRYRTFKTLAEELRPYIVSACRQKEEGVPSRGIPNGPILPDVRLACAIRWFSAASSYDLMTTYGTGHTDTINSYWYVVDAINRHPKFKIEYPKDHDQQRRIAQGFQNVSRAGFNCCAGAIDGILIWIHKPSKKDCKDVGCDTGKFRCGRKKKYGLNCQAVCDVRGRILDISIMYPGSTSDCLAFEGMSLFRDLEEGLLAPGLCLFGDSAYLNAPYMATPYTGVSGGTKDSYNFYHSQLRIRIECTFGMLTHRWAILRSAIPMNVGIAKTVALVVALAKLHNYCIDADERDIASNTARDEWNSEVNGAVPLAPVDEDLQHAGNEVIPEQLLHGGHHFDDIGTAGRRTRQRRYQRTANGAPLPRESLHSHIASIGVTRPTARPTTTRR
jgi:hypothetical protein